MLSHSDYIIGDLFIFFWQVCAMCGELVQDLKYNQEN